MESLKDQNIITNEIISTPAPFNTLLWRVIAKTDGGYVEGFYSIFDKSDEIKFAHYPSDENLLKPISEEWAVQRLKWFSKGFYKVQEKEDKIILSDLRMGVEPLYFFSFIVGKRAGDRIIPSPPEKIEDTEFDMGQSIKMLWQRIWNEDTDRLFVDNK